MNNYPSIACHRDCYSVLSTELNFEIELNDVIAELDDRSGVLHDKKKYGLMEEHSFGKEFYRFCVPKRRRWLLKSPLICEKNKKRILETWRNYPTVVITAEVKKLLPIHLPLLPDLVSIVSDFYGKYSAGVNVRCPKFSKRRE